MKALLFITQFFELSVLLKRSSHQMGQTSERCTIGSPDRQIIIVESTKNICLP